MTARRARTLDPSPIEPLADHPCACGSTDLIAIEPGTPEVRLAGALLIRGTPIRAWCAKCWPAIKERVA